MAIFGLVHGANCGSWCWRLLVPELERRGHVCRLVDLPTDDVSAGWDDHIAATLDAFPDPETIVVAHSRAGRMIPLLLQRQRFRKVVLVSASIPGGMTPPPYQSPSVPPRRVLDNLPPFQLDDLGRTVCTPERARLTLFSGCSPEVLAWALPLLRPQHELPVPDPVHWPIADVEYVVPEDDRAVDPAWMRMAARERLGVEPIDVPGDHSPFLSRPGPLADVLHRLASEPATSTPIPGRERRDSILP
ncbi:MAG: alpha/beta hydrolase [Acidimicrobiaceae bacterium]|nr:alpha/beta hydrolase [Acidimicrobiaceae bacterium]